VEKAKNFPSDLRTCN